MLKEKCLTSEDIDFLFSENWLTSQQQNAFNIYEGIVKTREEIESLCPDQIVLNSIFKEKETQVDNIQYSVHCYFYGESLDNLDLFEQTEAATYCKEDIVTEQNIEDSFTYTRLEQAVKKLREMSKEEYKQFLSKHKNISIDANVKPWKYATHCLKADPYGSIFICNDEQQLLYINGNWEPSDVYKDILKEIEIEYHPEINEECNLIERKSIKRYQEILDTKGVKELNKIYTDLCNSNSMGAIPNIVAIQVVLFNNDIELK